MKRTLILWFLFSLFGLMVGVACPTPSPHVQSDQGVDYVDIPLFE
jgi:hypothetical protein